jgi:hypothetical protein
VRHDDESPRRPGPDAGAIRMLGGGLTPHDGTRLVAMTSGNYDCEWVGPVAAELGLE